MSGENRTEERYRDYLNTLSLMSLRVLGRISGVAKASSLNKDLLVEELIKLYTHQTFPAPRSNKGAPAKQNFIDPAILEEIEKIGADQKQVKKDVTRESFVSVASGEERTPFIYDQPVYKGVLEITAGGYGFLRANNFQPSRSGGDVFVSAPAIHSLKLREGDFITCTVSPQRKNSDAPALNELLSVNGVAAGCYERRSHFEDLTARYPQEKIRFSDQNNALSLRVLDLFVPIGKGQRALIIAPPKAGKTTLLKDIASEIGKNHPEINLLILLIDERPEEVTDIRSCVEHAEIVCSTFDEGAEHHVRSAELTIEHARRMVEQGKHVVLLLDSLTKLTRAYNALCDNTGKTLSGGLDVGALAEPKRFFGAARNTVEGGSLTILATVLVDTGSRMDDVIYEEFKGTGNSDIFLSRELAERRIFPAIDIRRSGTRKEELLLDREELSAVYALRERGLCENTVGMLDTLKKTKNNEEFVVRLPEWLKTYKNM